MQKERNFGLDVLRAIAISLVVLSHATYLFVQVTENLFVLIVRTLGAIGVDLFFVLSGFLIGGLLLKEIEAHRTKFQHLLIFWKRRWWRTLPNYFLMLLVNIGVFYVFSMDLPESIGSYFTFTQNFTGPQAAFFTESWSLSIEEYAYLVLPFVIFCVLAIFKTGKRVFLYSTIGVVILAFVLKLHFFMNAEVSNYTDWTRMFRKVVVYRIDSIYIGFLLVYVFREYRQFFKKMRYMLVVLGAVVFIGTHLLIYLLNLQPESHLVFYVFLYLPLVSLSCALAFPFFIHLQRMVKINTLVYFVSTRSYAIYLVNFSAIMLSILYLVDLESVSLLYKVGLLLLYIILTGIIANLVYLYFEKPLLNYRDKNVH